MSCLQAKVHTDHGKEEWSILQGTIQKVEVYVSVLRVRIVNVQAKDQEERNLRIIF